MSDGIEKLQKYAFGMNPRRCDDILLLADQIKREHVSELQAIEAELGKRLMPEGLEWPRFDDGKQITWNDAPEDITAVCLALDGSCCSLHYDMPEDERMCIYDVSERVKRPVTEVLGADGLPINVGDTVYGAGREQGVYTVVSLRAGEGRFSVECEDRDGERCMVDASMVAHTKPDTQERIDEDALMDAGKYVAGHPEAARLREYPTSFSAKQAMMSDLLRRQREFDAKTMGGVE